MATARKYSLIKVLVLLCLVLSYLNLSVPGAYASVTVYYGDPVTVCEGSICLQCPSWYLFSLCDGNTRVSGTVDSVSGGSCIYHNTCASQTYGFRDFGNGPQINPDTFECIMCKPEFDPDDVDGDKHYKLGSSKTPNDDCNDNDETIYGGAPELCDNKNNDCDELTDEDIAPQSCYTGPEGTKNIGACKAGTQICTNGTWSECSGEILPSGEVCDNLDNDCDRETDEGLSTDADGDGHYRPNSCWLPRDDCYDNDPEIKSCCVDHDGDTFPGKSLICPDGPDCNDHIFEINPDAKEVCDGGIDNDCNPNTVEDCCPVTMTVNLPKVLPLVPRMPHLRYLISPGVYATDTTEVKVQMQKLSPDTYCSKDIELSLERVPNSCGHDHDDSMKPVGTLDRQDKAVFALSEESEETLKRTLIYNSPQVSGDVKLTLKADGKVIEKEIIFVMIPRVTWELPFGPPIAVGGGDDFPHKKNHFGTFNTTYSVYNLVTAYHEKHRTRLQINDMSLECGGVFDLCQTWEPKDTCDAYPYGGHLGHRIGKNVDVDDFTVEGTKVTKRKLNEVLKTRLKMENVRILDEGNHLDLKFP